LYIFSQSPIPYFVASLSYLLSTDRALKPDIFLVFLIQSPVNENPFQFLMILILPRGIFQP
jgi:hypothetical protein